MPVMIILAVSHLGFWGYGVSLGLQGGTIGLTGALALALWLGAIGLWLKYVARLSTSGWLTGPGVASLPWLWVPSPPVVLSLEGLFLLPVLREAWLALLAALPVAAVPALNALHVLAMGAVIKAWRV